MREFYEETGGYVSIDKIESLCNSSKETWDIYLPKEYYVLMIVVIKDQFNLLPDLLSVREKRIQLEITQGKRPKGEYSKYEEMTALKWIDLSSVTETGVHKPPEGSYDFLRKVFGYNVFTGPLSRFNKTGSFK
jgi:hypothetical protein